MVRKQDDFYDAINAAWEAQAVIPDDKPRTGGFSDLADEIEALMLDQTDKWLAGQDVPSDSVLANFVAYHHLTADWATRDALGASPVQPLLERYQKLTWSDYLAQLADLEAAGLPNELPFGVAPDFKDAQTYVLWADAPSTILPDTTYYAPDHAQGPELMAKWRETQAALFEAFGFDVATTTQILDDAIAYDAKIAQYVLSNEESAEYAKLYHPYAWADFKAMMPALPLGNLMTALLGEEPDQVIVPEERFWQHASEFYSADAWPGLKATLLVDLVNAYTGYLSNEIRILGGAYSRMLSGTPEPTSQQKSAYYLAAAPFNQALGLWYARTRFSPEAKADLEAKVATMVAVYQDRLGTVDWLAPETRMKAQAKLARINAHIGYPEKLPERDYQKIVEPGMSLFETAAKFRRQNVAYHWSRWHQKVDPTEWHMAAHQVNAYYSPQQNQIVFPAAILQAPFYTLDQSDSANYGGIGAVIAHEISHAFDTNGANFDEFGNLNDWWTPSDYANFEVRTQKVIDQFDGLDSYGAKVNGKLTVSENVADLGGVAAALQAAQQADTVSEIDFFDNFARIWRAKSRPEFMQMMAATDVHAPGKLRTNVTLPNFEAFHTTYDIQPGDQMYRAPEERVMIW